MRGTSKMSIVTKVIKYATVFAIGYYLGNCSANAESRLEKVIKYDQQEVIKYEQNFIKNQ